MKPSQGRSWLSVALLVLLGVGLAVGAATQFRTQERARRGSRGSLFAADDGGARALFLLLRSEGVSASPMTRRFDTDTKPGLLVIINPDGELSEDEAEDVSEWVAEGGALLALVDGPGNLTREFEVDFKPAKEKRIDRAAAVKRGGAAEAIATETDAGLEREDAKPLFSRGYEAQVLEFEWGDGQAVFVSDVFLATNAGLDAEDNAFFLLDVAPRLASKRPVYFLETVHGFLNEPSVAEYISDTGFAPAAVQIVIIVVFGAWTLGSRRAPPLEPSTLVRRPVAEHAATMAHLYRHGRSEQHATRVVLAELEAWLGRPASERALMRLDPEAQKAAREEVARLVEEGRRIAQHVQAPPTVVHHWIARTAAYKRRVTGAHSD